jgi:hypothetical protein
MGTRQVGARAAWDGAVSAPSAPHLPVPPQPAASGPTSLESISQAIQALESVNSEWTTGKRTERPPSFGSYAAREPVRWVDPNICSSDEIVEPALFGRGDRTDNEYPPVHERADSKYWLTGPNVSPALRTANLSKWPGAHYLLHVYRHGGANPPPYCDMSLITPGSQATRFAVEYTVRRRSYDEEVRRATWRRQTRDFFLAQARTN